MMLYGQTGKHKSPKNKRRELSLSLSTVCFENSQLRTAMLLVLPHFHSIPPGLLPSVAPLATPRD